MNMSRTAPPVARINRHREIANHLHPADFEALAQTDLSETTCVVFDILRATSSMVTALANGAERIRPVATIEEAQRPRPNIRRHYCAANGMVSGSRPSKRKVRILTSVILSRVHR